MTSILWRNVPTVKLNLRSDSLAGRSIDAMVPNFVASSAQAQRASAATSRCGGFCSCQYHSIFIFFSTCSWHRVLGFRRCQNCMRYWVNVDVLPCPCCTPLLGLAHVRSLGVTA